MEYRHLGKSGVQVSALSFGSWLTFGKQISDDTAGKLMQSAYDEGINFFDNAEVYARGRSEVVMGRILKKMNWPRDTFLISSKVYWGGDKPNQTGLSKKHIFEACHASLKRLQLDYLDFFFCHRPDKSTPVVETVWAMHQLIMQGKVLYWGTSEWSAQEIQQAIGIAGEYKLIPPVMEQPQYNLFWRERMEVEYAKLFLDYGIGTTVWSPLASGVLSGKYNEAVPGNTRLSLEGLEWLKERSLSPDRIDKAKKLQTLADELGVTLAQLSIAWCLKNPHVSTVISGASGVRQLKENLHAVQIQHKLDERLMDSIDQLLGNKPEQPQF